MSTIEFRDVSVSYEDNVPVLSNVSLTLTERRIGIIGANGGGKSTLVRLINGLETPSAGTVTFNGLDVANNAAAVRRQVGFVFADAENQIVMPNVRDDVAFSLRRYKMPKAERLARADAALDRFGLTPYAARSPHTLSGGQKQMLALASIAVMDPELIIADEPTTLLDLRNREALRAEFARLDQQLIVVSHDLDFLRDFDRVLCIHDHQVAFDGSPADATAFYTELMLGEGRA